MASRIFTAYFVRPHYLTRYAFLFQFSFLMDHMLHSFEASNPRISGASPVSPGPSCRTSVSCSFVTHNRATIGPQYIHLPPVIRECAPSVQNSLSVCV